ncbi:N-acetyltransferase family protein [Sorangium sp. So ce1182]|uniref:GNAT family N-acetyltransferase n=1 Tax=Sorangium sp. So ce1182 TaxID=3133334 RepID=UPI003F5F4BD7
MSVRRLTDADAAELRALRLRALREEPDPFLTTFDEDQARPLEDLVARLRQQSDASDSAVLGALEAGALVGMLGFYRDAHRKARHRVNLWGMYVAPEARGRGHGRALIDAALSRVAAIPGVEQVHLSVSVTSEAARGLYLRAGFKVVGLLPRAMKDGDRYIDEELMVRSL